MEDFNEPLPKPLEKRGSKLDKYKKETDDWLWKPINRSRRSSTIPPFGLIIQDEDESETYRDAYLLISNWYDAPEEVAAVYVKRWRIEVFYRTVKQELGLTNCHSRSEEAHFTHMELLFTVETLLCYAK